MLPAVWLCSSEGSLSNDCTGIIEEVMGLNPVGATLVFWVAVRDNPLNSSRLSVYKDHFSLLSIAYPLQIYTCLLKITVLLHVYMYFSPRNVMAARALLNSTHPGKQSKFEACDLADLGACLRTDL